MATITQLRHAYPENAGFTIDRQNGHPQFTFLHFITPVDILIDGGIVHAPPHACILYAPNERQYFHSKKNLLHDWIHFIAEPNYPAKFSLQTNRLYYPDQTDFITQLTREAENEFYSSFSCREEMLALKLDELFFKLRRAVNRENQPPVDQDAAERFRALRGEIFSSLAKAWTVEKMAKRVQLSQSRFYALYKALYGVSPVDDLIRARLDSAKNALAFGTDTVSQIAESLGYNNVSHFIRQFTSREGISPAAYRSRQK